MQYLLLHFIPVFSFCFLCGFLCGFKEKYKLLVRFHVLCSRFLLGSVCHQILFFGVRFTPRTTKTKTNPTNNPRGKERNRLWHSDSMWKLLLFLFVFKQDTLPGMGWKQLKQYPISKAISGEWKNEEGDLVWLLVLKNAGINPKVKHPDSEMKLWHVWESTDKGTKMLHYWQLV